MIISLCGTSVTDLRAVPNVLIAGSIGIADVGDSVGGRCTASTGISSNRRLSANIPSVWERVWDVLLFSITNPPP